MNESSGCRLAPEMDLGPPLRGPATPGARHSGGPPFLGSATPIPIPNPARSSAIAEGTRDAPC